jgi:Raf kinase inhibitor-like YbhB/YbcL family protein
MALQLSSPAFADGGEIPRDYTADGDDEPPPLTISGVPDGAESLALVVEDPDAPHPNFTHWVVWHIPTSTKQLGPKVPGDAFQGKNDFGRQGYGGPKPPSGRHRYVFKLFALDTDLAEDAPLTKQELERRIQGHVVEQTALVGTYARAA